MGVVRMYRYGYYLVGVVVRRYIRIYRYPHNNYILLFPTPFVSALFFQQHPYFIVH